MARGSAKRHSRSESSASDRKLLVIDTTNTFELIKARGTEDSVTCRDLDGYFSRVWSVHPVATLTTSDQWTRRFGPAVEYRLNERHVFIEGKVGRFPVLRRFFLINFLIAQAGLFLSLYGLIRRERISVIRAGDPLYTGLIAWALARLSGIPFVVRLGANHDKVYETTGQLIMPRLFRKRRYEKMAERFVFRRADLVAAANADNLNFALANGARPDRSTVFAYGNLIDRRHFSDPSSRGPATKELRSLGVEAGRFLILISRLIASKYPEDAISVLAKLRSRGHDLKLVIVGEGPERHALEHLGRQLGVADYLIFVGNQDQQWLASVMPEAAAVVSPITGRALAEAALASAPIAAYDVDWQPDLIETGVTGELVSFRSCEAMAESIERYLNDRHYAAKMGRGARDRVLEMLHPDKLNAHERREYARLLEGRSEL